MPGPKIVGRPDRTPPTIPLPTGSPREVSGTPYRKRFEWTAQDSDVRIGVVVARPYWLLPLAETGEKVIWAPVGAAALGCSARSSRPARTK
jgi:hypothetical protein